MTQNFVLSLTIKEHKNSILGRKNYKVGYFFMLEALCGSKSVQKILLFLFVNNKCYGAMLQRQLKTPLTPIQKALKRLEQGGVITSHFEGKTRIYRFNPSYPLLEELESLLKKTYTLLPSHEKKDFYVFEKNPTEPNHQLTNKYKTLISCWEVLNQMSYLIFNAQSKSNEKTGWHGRGKGTVSVTKEDANTLIFTEKGTWHGKSGDDMNFSNVFRWTIDRHACMISLEKLSRGSSFPVFLFHLAPTQDKVLSSVDSHLCANDTYFGKIFLKQDSLKLSWRVIGPKKNEEIDYFYS